MLGLHYKIIFHCTLYLLLIFLAGDICSLPKVEGLCKGFIPQWFYNSDRGRCEQFVYGGCGGNANKFNTKAACLMRCAGN